MSFVLGLTGHIASGKTSASEIFSKFGIQVLSADKVSKELTLKNTDAYKEIIAHFGSQVIDKNAELNRKILRHIIFSEPKERVWLENLLHPLIRKGLEDLLSLCTTAYSVVEIPLLFDKQKYPYLKKILVITAPKDIQIARVITRDKCSKEQTLAILSAQPTLDLYLKNADYRIHNAGSLDDLEQELKKLHEQLLTERA
jgi:dephospho-CoA kinase